MSIALDKGSKGLIAALENHTEVTDDDILSKKELRASQSEAQKSQETDQVINRLIKLKENGIISEEAFKQNVKVATGLWRF